MKYKNTRYQQSIFYHPENETKADVTQQVSICKEKDNDKSQLNPAIVQCTYSFSGLVEPPDPPLFNSRLPIAVLLISKLLKSVSDLRTGSNPPT
jgi:hypothetical protein